MGLEADDLFRLEEEKSFLFEFASKSMRTYKNSLRCAYALQIFGSQVKREVQRELRRARAFVGLDPGARALETEAAETVHEHYRIEFEKGGNWHKLERLRSVAAYTGKLGKELGPLSHVADA